MDIWLPKSIDYTTSNHAFYCLEDANHYIRNNNPSEHTTYNHCYEYGPMNRLDQDWLLGKYGIIHNGNLNAWCNTAAEKLVKYILRPRFMNYVFTAHNAGGFDLNLIYKVLEKMGFSLNQLHRNKSLDFISLYISGPLNILFLDTLKYFSNRQPQQSSNPLWITNM